MAVLQKFSERSEENARIAKEDLFGLQNSQKAITGYQSGLIDKAIMDKKAADEAGCGRHSRSNSKALTQAIHGKKSPRRSKTQTGRSIPNLLYIERMRGFASHLAPDCEAAGAGCGREAEAEWRADARISRFWLAVAEQQLFRLSRFTSRWRRCCWPIR